MFTGLIEDIGTLAERAPRGEDATLRVRTGLPLSEVALGDSIAVQGACLTVTRIADGAFWADASVETLRRTTLGTLRPGARVHLERALTLQKRLDGHLVQGHIDGRGVVDSARLSGRSLDLWLRLDAELLPEVANKGSIAVDGVSLTVNEVVGERARLTIVPHTLEWTRLGELRAGDLVNIETDVLAKYVRRLLTFQQPDAPTDGRLASLLHQFGYDSASERSGR